MALDKTLLFPLAQIGQYFIVSVSERSDAIQTINEHCSIQTRYHRSHPTAAVILPVKLRLSVGKVRAHCHAPSPQFRII